MRHSMANEKKLRGPTHASVYESTMDNVNDVVVDAIMPKKFVESFTTKGSISILA